MEDRAYQEEAVVWLLPRRRGLIHAPAGSGKTRIAALALSRRVWKGATVLWMVNTIEQKQQAIDAIQATPCPVECDMQVSCTAAGPCIAATDVIIVDECHHLPADSWFGVLKYARPNAIVWGLTATPNHEDPARNAMVQAFFPEKFEIDRARLVASGHLMPGHVFIHDVDTSGEFDTEIEAATVQETRIRCRRFPLVPPAEHYRRAKWQITQEFIYKNEKRNTAIVSLAQAKASSGLSVLLLIRSIEHGEALVARLSGASIVHSKVGAKTRRNLISSFREGTLGILVSSSLADEGLDVPRAAVLVLAAGGRSSGLLEQRTGRVLRPFPGKVAGEVIDFLDRGALFAYAQAKSRIKTYEKLGYPVEIVRHGAPVAEMKEPQEMTGDWDGFR